MALHIKGQDFRKTPLNPFVVALNEQPEQTQYLIVRRLCPFDAMHLARIDECDGLRRNIRSFTSYWQQYLVSDFDEFVSMARHRLPRMITLLIASNGPGLDEDSLRAILPILETRCSRELRNCLHGGTICSNKIGRGPPLEIGASLRHRIAFYIMQTAGTELSTAVFSQSDKAMKWIKVLWVLGDNFGLGNYVGDLIKREYPSLAPRTVKKMGWAMFNSDRSRVDTCRYTLDFLRKLWVNTDIYSEFDYTRWTPHLVGKISRGVSRDSPQDVDDGLHIIEKLERTTDICIDYGQWNDNIVKLVTIHVSQENASEAWRWILLLEELVIRSGQREDFDFSRWNSMASENVSKAIFNSFLPFDAVRWVSYLHRDCSHFGTGDVVNTMEWDQQIYDLLVKDVDEDADHAQSWIKVLQGELALPHEIPRDGPLSYTEHHASRARLINLVLFANLSAQPRNPERDLMECITLLDDLSDKSRQIYYLDASYPWCQQIKYAMANVLARDKVTEALSLPDFSHAVSSRSDASISIDFTPWAGIIGKNLALALADGVLHDVESWIRFIETGSHRFGQTIPTADFPWDELITPNFADSLSYDAHEWIDRIDLMSSRLGHPIHIAYDQWIPITKRQFLKQKQRQDAVGAMHSFAYLCQLWDKCDSYPKREDFEIWADHISVILGDLEKADYEEQDMGIWSEILGALVELAEEMEYTGTPQRMDGKKELDGEGTPREESTSVECVGCTRQSQSSLGIFGGISQLFSHADELS